MSSQSTKYCAGAVGAFYGAKLQQAGEDVVLCVRGENLRAMRERGLEVKSYKGDFKLAVKATDLTVYDAGAPSDR